MVEINKYKTALNSFEIGTKFILKNLMENKLPSNPKKANDFVICEVATEKIQIEAKLWVRHLLNECEMVTGERFENFLIKKSLGNVDLDLPDFFKIIGYNKDTERVVIEPEFIVTLNGDRA